MSGSVEVTTPVSGRCEEILTPEALAFLADLHERFDGRRLELLELRAQRRGRIAAGESLDFAEETRSVREDDWRVSAPPADLRDRRVEITGPTRRNMVVNALNSGARGFMADFEDSNSPTWQNMIEGHVNLVDAIERRIDFTDEGSGKSYALDDEVATLLVRPRGWHLPEKHLRVGGRPLAGALVDAGLYLFHGGRRALEHGSGAYFYLPKLESHLEARLWNDVFVRAQEKIGVPRGTIKATVLIEKLPAAFEMDEILHELKDLSAGLNCGRWDYIFSFIKKRSNDPSAILPDRGQVTMDKAFLDAYVTLLIATCHRRGVHAMGGMAAQIPIKSDAAKN
ncbi:MAG: malate synthase, partial [Solirubrobacteraceae bacterium]|nr:malate synthase [Solirubrobacteraceae bacterium]